MSPNGLTSILSPCQPATDTHWLRPENRRRRDDREAHTAWPGSLYGLRSEGFAEDLPEGISIDPPEPLPLLPGR